MKALIFDPHARRGLRFGDVGEPKPTAAQALVEVHAISLNFGELAFLEHKPRDGAVRFRGPLLRRSRGDTLFTPKFYFILYLLYDVMIT
jgi:hypothetical protein